MQRAPRQPLRSGRLPGGGFRSAETSRRRENPQNVQVQGMEARGMGLRDRSLVGGLLETEVVPGIIIVTIFRFYRELSR